MGAIHFLSSGTLLLLSCITNSAALSDFSVVTTNISVWDQRDWSLTTNQYNPGQYQSRISLANGYVGASLAAAGPFFEVDVNQTNSSGTQPTNGWPLFDPRISFSTISGFYDVQENATGTNYPWLQQYGWESFIAGIPHPTDLIFSFADSALDAKVANNTISNFTSSISFKTGVASWKYVWQPLGSTISYTVSFAAIFSRLRANVVAVKAEIIASSDSNGTVTDLLDGSSAVRAYSAGKGLDEETTIWSAVHPNNLANITAYVYSSLTFDSTLANTSSRTQVTRSMNDTTIGQCYQINLKAGQTATFYKYVGVASNDRFSDAQSTARQASLDALNSGWDVLLAEHTQAWATLLPDDVVDNFTDPVTGTLPSDSGIQAIQISSVANAFYLLQNLMPDGSGLNDNSIAVGGLASDSYAGLIFWDADYWMAPGLNLAFPAYSKQISNFRVKQHSQALANAAFNGYPNGSSLYSWTAGRYGNCTGTGPCVDYEYHLNYDISFNLFQEYNVTGNRSWFENGPRQIIASTAMMTGQLLQYNTTTQTYWLLNMTDPDEYANNVDNGAFTIASAADLLALENLLRISENTPINNTWASQALNIEFPRAASNITLEYQTMNDSVQVKQADVVLLTYPLDYNQNGYSTAEKLLDLDYYSNRQSPDGPAMTYSVFAVDANALSPSGCAAYTYTLDGMVTYLRAPWYQFSEQAVDDVTLNGGTNPAFPFLTGHGGANQVVPFGFLGVRTDQDVLFVNPSLPPQIPQVKIRNIFYGGAGLSIFMNRTHTTMTRFSTANNTRYPGVIDKYVNTTMPVISGTPGDPSTQSMYSIAINETITVPNRLYFTNLTYPGNLIQCLPVSSPSSFSPGQFPTAATDGASATHWQPSTNATSSLTVNMSTVAFKAVTSIYFDWATRPARTAAVYLGNYSALDAEGYHEEVVINIDSVGISTPYNPSSAAQAVVQPYVGNTTTVTITEDGGGSPWSGDYVRLEIEGCAESDGMGATVAEFVLI